MPHQTSPSHILRQYIDRILSHAAPGDPLPTDRDIASRLGISIPTVQRLMRSLRKEGRVTRIPGKGTFAGTSLVPSALPPPRKSSWEQIADIFRQMISSGKISIGRPLPSVKSAAVHYRVAPATVIAAYRCLSREGLTRRIGKACIAGPGEGTGMLRTRRHGYLFLPDGLSAEQLLQNDRLSQEMVKMERELHRNRFSVEYRSIHDFGALAIQWRRKGNFPNGLVYIRPEFGTNSSLRVQLAKLRHRAGISFPRVIVIGEGRERPVAGVLRYHEANPLTQVCRCLAEFIHRQGYSRTAVFLDRSAGGRYGFGGMLKLRTELLHLTSRCRFQFVIRSPETPPGDAVGPAPLGKLGPDEPVPVASKYSAATRGEIERDIVFRRDVTEQYRTAVRGDAWVFTRDRDAVDALDWAGENGINVPGTVSIISLENNPAFLHRGITCCVRDWEAAGYLLAHALLGDIPIARTRRGFIRTSALLLERRTTP